MLTFQGKWTHCTSQPSSPSVDTIVVFHDRSSAMGMMDGCGQSAALTYDFSVAELSISSS